jgi:tripartite-type tricarboxylate transporter receptor subunit TctC
MTHSNRVALRRTGRHALLAAMACWSLFTCSLALAADNAFPQRTVRIVVGNAPGSAMDTVSRIIAQKLMEALGQAVVTENRAGASGIIASDYVAKALPDGYTLIMGSAAMTMVPASFGTRAVDPSRAFAPIIKLVNQPLLVAANPAYKVTTFRELLALARREPDTVPFSTAGIGTPAHLAAELLMASADIKMLHLPYSGVGLIYRDVLSGQVPVTITYPGAAIPLVKSNQLRALAVTGDHRLEALPDTPTIAESGVRDFVVTAWYGLLAPAGTPAEIIERLNREVARTMAMPEIRERLIAIGLEPATGTPEQFAAEIRSDLARWGPIIKKLKIKVE